MKHYLVICLLTACLPAETDAQLSMQKMFGATYSWTLYQPDIASIQLEPAVCTILWAPCFDPDRDINVRKNRDEVISGAMENLLQSIVAAGNQKGAPMDWRLADTNSIKNSAAESAAVADSLLKLTGADLVALITQLDVFTEGGITEKVESAGGGTQKLKEYFIRCQGSFTLFSQKGKLLSESFYDEISLGTRQVTSGLLAAGPSLKANSDKANQLAYHLGNQLASLFYPSTKRFFANLPGKKIFRPAYDAIMNKESEKAMALLSDIIDGNDEKDKARALCLRSMLNHETDQPQAAMADAIAANTLNADNLNNDWLNFLKRFAPDNAVRWK